MNSTSDKATILIVDDDPEITATLARGLAMHGYNTVCENEVARALIRFRADQVNAAIVDVMIGNDSGIDLVTAARGEGNTKPVLMLSALSEVDDRARGLAAGADDYIVKPFAFEELVARLKVQEQRAQANKPTIGVYDPIARSIRNDNREVQLTERESDLLENFLQNHGSILSRGEIFDALWAGEGTTSENVVDVYVGYLRKKLSPISDFGFEIKTIRNRGFVLEYSSA